MTTIYGPPLATCRSRAHRQLLLVLCYRNTRCGFSAWAHAPIWHPLTNWHLCPPVPDQIRDTNRRSRPHLVLDVTGIQFLINETLADILATIIQLLLPPLDTAEVGFGRLTTGDFLSYETSLIELSAWPLRLVHPMLGHKGDRPFHLLAYLDVLSAASMLEVVDLISVLIASHAFWYPCISC